MHMRKNIGRLFTIILLFVSFLNANEKLVNKKKANIEKGFRFGEFKDSNETNDESLKNINPKDIGKILLLQLKEDKKHTKLLTEIRDILQSEYDPKAKMITVNGKQCIENSSADCFKMPMINEVKKIPAIANAYKDPTLKNIKIRELYYAKYTKEVLRDAYLKGQAIRELGPKYPLATRPLGTVDSGAGWDGPIIQKHRKNLFLKHLNNFEFNLFLGLNNGLDMYSLVPLAYLVRDNPNVKINLIFNTRASKDHWEKQYKNFFTAKYLINLQVFIQPDAFKEFKIYTSPSLFIKDLKNTKDTLIHIGKLTELDLINKTIAYMLANKFIKRNDLSAREFWNTEGSDKYLEFYYKNKLGIDYEK